MSAWAVGRNMVGYSPDPDNVAYFRTWEEAREYLECEMRLWAQEEDEAQYATAETLEELEGMSSVKAHVGAIFAVDGVQLTPDQEVYLIVEDSRGWGQSFWIAPVDESDVDEYVWGEED